VTPPAASVARPVRVATIGAALSANKGAAAMLRTVLEVLPDRLGACRFAVLTTYPEADRPRADEAGVRVVSLRPLELVFPVLPLLAVGWLLRRLGGSGRLADRHPAVRVLTSADVVVDLAGVSFVDGRGIPILGYNVLMTGAGLLSGTPVVKAAQALGPFRGRLNRLAAGFVLPRVATVVARGERTREHLADLGLTNADEAADLAFLLPVHDPDRDAARVVLEQAGVVGPYLTVVPSAVVEGYATSRGLDYPALMVRSCERLAAATGRPVVVLAHSARPGEPAGRMNDLPLVRTVGERATDPRVVTIDEDLEPAVLRSIIGGGEVCVTSRFHAMVAALAEVVPVLVVGWSHKYGEVLHDVGLDDWALTYDELTPGTLDARLDALLAEREAVARTLRANLPAVVARARRNLVAIERVLGSARGTASGEGAGNPR
jgi:colanic acid/amylovoran biosynthesis protein